MNDTSTPRPGSGVNGDGLSVNLRGINLVEAREAPMVTISLLSEGVEHCDDCGKEILGLAAYHTRQRPSRYDGWELVKLTCPRCAGHDGRVA